MSQAQSTTRGRGHQQTLVALALSALFAGTGAQAANSGTSWCGERCDEVVIDWNQTTHQVISAADGYSNPMAASRVLAMVHLAMHDAVNAVDPRYAAYGSYAQDATHKAEADAAVAAVVAAHDVLLALYPAQKPLLKTTLDKTLHDAGPGAAIDAAKALGAQAAGAVLARRANDGSSGSESYRVGNAPGDYRFTPGFDFIAAPHWRSVVPFALTSASQFRVAAPPPLTSHQYTAAFREVKDSGSAHSTRRTADQTQYAAFWYEFSDAGWNRIARVVARSQRQDLWQRARGFALLNAAMADAYIAGWDSKMHHNFWRPVSAIRLAATDGNPATEADAQWSPLLPTPPIQDHPSTHSALGAAAAVVLAHVFGRDQVHFTFASPTAPASSPSRSFPSFSAAALENADSRVRAGLHFRFATVEGLQLGRRIGQHVVASMLQPAH